MLFIRGGEKERPTSKQLNNNSRSAQLCAPAVDSYYMESLLLLTHHISQDARRVP